MPKATVEQVDAILPQTQCGQCGYGGCLPYAKALVEQGEAIDRCPPGGKTGVSLLATLLEQDPTPYLQKMTDPPVQLANIREALCIGCTKCIQVCPVDAIIGSAKWMHSIMQDECTGCGLCVPVCPMDCIDLLPVEKLNYKPQQAKARYQAKLNRQNVSLIEEKSVVQNDKLAFIQAAVARAKAKRQGRQENGTK